MLLLITWIVIYIFIVLALNKVVRPAQNRAWFKILFFPGTLLAAAVQAVAARLCVGSAYRISLIRDGKAAFEFEKKRLPLLSGALFLLVAHLIIYLLYMSGALFLDSRGVPGIYSISLPNLYPQELFRGVIYFDFREYLSSLQALFRNAQGNPLPYAILLYGVAGTLAAMRVAGRESICALILVLLFSCLGYLVEWFGVGFSFWSRGWWAEIFYFPDWWALLSLFVSLVGISLSLFLIPALFHFSIRLLPGKEKPAKARKPAREKAGATA